MLIEKFIEYLKIEKNYSVNTLTAYKKDLIEFQVFINENFDKCVIKNVDYKNTLGVKNKNKEDPRMMRIYRGYIKKYFRG